MRICHLTSVHKPNDIRIFIKQCCTLAKKDFDVHYVVPNSKSYKKNNVNIHGIDSKNSSRIRRMFKTTKLVYKTALNINADVYHFHDPELIPIGLKLKRKGKKVIYDVHEDIPRSILSKKYINPIFKKPISKTFEAYEKYAARKFDRIVTATPFINQRFKLINDGTVNVNNYPILKELYSEKKSKSKRQSQKYVSYVGGFSENRGSSQIIRAANNFDCMLKVAGPISNSSIKKEIEVHPNITYLSIINRKEVKELLQNSIAGLVTFLPEPNHINAQPNKMFEYMSAGIPVIASNFSLWKDIIETHNCGICVDPESPEDIKNAVNYLLENPNQVIEMGKNGRKAIEQKFNWEKESKKLLNLYDGLSIDKGAI